jgi:2-octaprenyl-6-methoxyphenol hydroxylase
MNHYDVAIVGGGMVGASFALALRATRLRVLLIEGVPPGEVSQPSFDDRTTALGNGSRQIFQTLGVWEEMAPQAGAIRSIHVSDAGKFGVARLDAHEQHVEAFGYVVPNRVIGQVLWKALRNAPNIRLATPARLEKATLRADGVELTICGEAGSEQVHAALAVAADGAGSVLRASAGIGADVEDYEQVAIVLNAATDRPNRGEAFERFTASGPLAVLPLGNGPRQPGAHGGGDEFKGGYAVVWAVTPDRAAELLALDEAAFASRLLEAFGWRAGRWTRIGRRHTYPLTLSRARDTVAGRVVLIGNAAQALHPVAGQGFNLGLRDAATLAEMLVETPSTAAPERDMDALLTRFAAWRDEDRGGVTRFTDGLVKLFGSDRPGLSTVRNFGLLLFDLSPAAKRALSRVSWGFAGRMPRLARGLPLE